MTEAEQRAAMTPQEESEQRARVVAVARSYLGTAYHHMGRKKGVGVDCLTLIAGVFEEAGLVPPIDIPFYPRDWHLHRSAERYLTGLLRYARRIDGPPQPGDVALWKFGRCFSHGAVVVEWPLVVHSFTREGCVLEDASRSARLCVVGENVAEKGKPRPVQFFSFWG